MDSIRSNGYLRLYIFNLFYLICYAKNLFKFIYLTGKKELSAAGMTKRACYAWEPKHYCIHGSCKSRGVDFILRCKTINVAIFSGFENLKAIVSGGRHQVSGVGG